MTQNEAHEALVEKLVLGFSHALESPADPKQTFRSILAFIYSELKEPCEEMVDAARANDDAGNYNFRDEWRAMLAASPLTKGEWNDQR